MKRCAGGGIMRSSVATRYQLGLLRHAGSVTVPSRASTPHGTCESAMNAARSAGMSAANEAANLSRSRYKKPSCGGRIGGTGAPGGGSAINASATERPAFAGRSSALAPEPPAALALRRDRGPELVHGLLGLEDLELGTVEHRLALRNHRAAVELGVD